MSAEIHIVAIITPAAGKEDRVRELLTELAANVKQHETGVLKYHMFEQYNAADGVNVFVVEEIYENQAAHEAHFKMDYFTALGKTIGEENIFAAPLDIKTIKPFAGFASR